MKLSDFVAYDAVGLCALIRSGEVSRDEVHQVANEAIDLVNPTLNAVVHRFEVKGHRGEHSEANLLAGFPLLLKDQLELVNTPMSLGTRVAKLNRCALTHPIAQRMLDAGIDIIGRTNMSELGLLPTTEPVAYGPTPNPWNEAYSPGGSSGGSAAAVASGMTPMAYGADGGGSIRIPAANCGLFGLKPSRNLHPQVIGDEPFHFIVHNPISRTVRDTAALMDITANTGTRFSDAIARNPERKRIAFITTRYDGEPIDQACRDAVYAAARLFENLGHRVEEIAAPPEFAQIEWGLRVFWVMSAGYFFKQVRNGLLERVGDRMAGAMPPVRLLRRALSMPWPRAGALVEPFTAAVGRLDRFFQPSDVWLAWTEFQRAEQALHALFAEYDMLLTPTTGQPPWPIGHFDQRAPESYAEEMLRSYVPFTPLLNMTGFPAMNLPLHWHEGLPVGVQCIAEHDRDDELLCFAAEVERAQPWNAKAPPFHLRRLLSAQAHKSAASDQAAPPAAALL